MAGHDTNSTTDNRAARAAAAVFAEYGSFIRAVIRFQASNEFIEEDLFQEFFLLLVAKPLPVKVYNIKSYLYRAVTNVVIESARRQARQERYLKKHVEEIRIAVNTATPQSAIIKTEETESVFRYLVGQLRRREAEAVILRYRDNRSIAEIAREMGVDKRTVSHYLSAGLKRLRRARAIE